MLYIVKHCDESVLVSYLISCCIVCVAINVSTSKYMVVSFILWVRGGARKEDRGEKCSHLKRYDLLFSGLWTRQRNKNAKDQHAPIIFGDKKSLASVWQAHDMANMIAPWEYKHYQIAHQMVKCASIWHPFFGYLDPPITGKIDIKSMHNHCVYVFTRYASVAVCKTGTNSCNASAS